MSNYFIVSVRVQIYGQNYLNMASCGYSLLLFKGEFALDVMRY